jgi:hypothetical protein
MRTSTLRVRSDQKPGPLSDDVHIVNPGGSAGHVTVSIPGCVDRSGALIPASERVRYFQCFNEVIGLTPQPVSGPPSSRRGAPTAMRYSSCTWEGR